MLILIKVNSGQLIESWYEILRLLLQFFKRVLQILLIFSLSFYI